MARLYRCGELRVGGGGLARSGWGPVWCRVELCIVPCCYLDARQRAPTLAFLDGVAACGCGELCMCAAPASAALVGWAALRPPPPLTQALFPLFPCPAPLCPQPGGPIFFYTGNEGPIELFAQVGAAHGGGGPVCVHSAPVQRGPSASTLLCCVACATTRTPSYIFWAPRQLPVPLPQNSGFLWDIAPEFGAMLVFAEHRCATARARCPCHRPPVSRLRGVVLCPQRRLTVRHHPALAAHPLSHPPPRQLNPSTPSRPCTPGTMVPACRLGRPPSLLPRVLACCSS
jgi:hypothetical protein